MFVVIFVAGASGGDSCEFFNYVKSTGECQLLSECNQYDRSCAPDCLFDSREGLSNGDCTFPGICSEISIDSSDEDLLEDCSQVVLE